MSRFTPRLYWFIHHAEVLEMSVEPIGIRRSYVRAYKPTIEVPVRLKWMRPVKHPELLPRAAIARAKGGTQCTT